MPFKTVRFYYNNASEVIRKALRFMDTHEDWIHEVKLARLREQLKTGTDQLDRGEGIAIESKAALDALFDDIKNWAHIRSLPIQSHILFYRVAANNVEIIRVLHGRQDPLRHMLALRTAVR